MEKSSYNKYGINTNTYEMFFDKKVDCVLDERIMAIRAFTSNSCIRKKYYIAKGYRIRTDDDKMIMQYKKDIFGFIKISDILSSDEKEFLKIKQELLDYKKRKHQCHSRSVQFFSLADNLVTGYVDDVGNNRIIHTWLETDENVIDYTSNLIINKEDYYKLMNAEVLSVISKDEFDEDIDSEFLNKIIGIKFYCLFRQELEQEGIIKNGCRQLKK